MPNWMEGSLKLRGNSENILRFFKEGLTAYVGRWNENNEYENIPVEKEKWLEIIDNGNDTEVYLNPVDSAWIHVDNTKRAFIDGRYGIIFNNVPENVIAVTDIRHGILELTNGSKLPTDFRLILCCMESNLVSDLCTRFS